MTVKMSYADIALLDRERGGVSRSGYLRWLFHQERLRFHPPSNGDPAGIEILPEKD